MSKYKAVIVDDEMFAREFLNQCINDLCTDFEVCAMLNDGSNAIEYLKENKADVILSDVRMPGISGIELAKYINDNNMNIPIVLVSAYDDFKYAQEAMRYGVKYYLLKVIDTNELVAIMNNIKKELDERKTVLNNKLLINKEMFFYDILFKIFTNKEEIKTIYNALEYDIPYDSAVCDIYSLKINCLERLVSDKYNGDFDAFKEMLVEMLWMMYGKRYVMASKPKNSDFLIIALCHAKEPHIASEQIEYEIFELFSLDAKVKNRRFKTLYDLYKENAVYDGKEKRNIENVHEMQENADVKDEYIQTALEYINGNYNKAISRTDVAEFIHLNSDYFGCIFKERMGKNFSEYLMNIRMKKAIELLKTGENLERVAFAVGYQDVRNFRRNFQRFTGVTFSEFKNKIKNGEISQ